MKPFNILSVALLLCVPAVFQAQETEETCSQQTCIEGAFKYATGKTYRYSYITQITTTLPDQPDTTTFSLHATAEVSALSACSHRLAVKLQNVSDQNSAFPAESFQQLRNNLEKNPVDFGFYNGIIGEVCYHNDESPLALNIKKGILSAFQVSATTVDGFTKGTFLEVDMAGECPTIYTLSHGSDNQLFLNKTRTLSECTDAEKQKQPVPLLHPTSLGSTVQSLLESNPTCQHFIRDGVLRSATCVERHTVKPFRQQTNPLTVRVTQQLTFEEEISRVTPRKNNNRQLTGTLRFALSDVPEVTQKSLEEALGDLCAVSTADVRPETPKAFAKFVDVLQAETDCTTVEALFDQLGRGVLCSALTDVQRDQILHDTLPAVGSSCSVKLMTQLLQQGDVDFADAELWFVSLAFIRNPTRDMVETLVPLMSNADLPRSGYLGISTLARNYCAFQSGDCDGMLLSAIEVAILKNVNPTCESSDDTVNTEQTITYLKAIGNIGPSQYTMDVLPLVFQCKQKPIAVRLAAVEALRRRDCNEISKTTELSKILADASEKVELRIAAYRTLMACPDDAVIRDAVKVSADEGESLPLRQYIVSHLRNLNDSTGVVLADVREILADLPTLPVLGSGALTSRNFLMENGDKDKMTIVDGNVLFADSYLPRAADVAFGVELFGRRIDLLQIGGRAEGFEATVEKMVGPSGHFSQRSLKDGVMSLLFGSDSKAVDRKLLSDRMKKQREEFAFKEDPADFLAYFRMFGNDLAFATLDDMKTAADSLLQGYIGALDFLFGRTEEIPFEVSRNVKLFDSDFNIPTSSGLPLNIQLAATASGKVSGKARMNIAGLFKQFSQFSPFSLFSRGGGVTLAGQIAPSFAVQVSAAFKMNLHDVTTGFSTVVTLHSSTDFSGSVEIENGKFIRTKLDLPKEKMEFVTFDSRSYGLRGTEERLIVSDPAVSTHSALSECTAPLTSRLFGVEFCAELDSEDPLVGGAKRDGLLPANFRLFLRKTDPGMTGYKFALEYPSPNSFGILFDTPGSRVSRHFQLTYALSRQNGTLTGVFATPWKKYDLDGQLTSPTSLRLGVIEDGLRPYTLTVSSEGRMVDGYYNLQPRLTVVTPFSEPIEVTGTLNYKPTGTADARADLTMTSLPLTCRLLVTHKAQDTGLSTQATLQYRAARAARSQEVILNYKSRNFPTVTGLVKRGATCSVEFTEFPHFNTLVQADVLHSPDSPLSHIESTFNIYRQNFQDESRKILVRTLLTTKKVAGRWNVTTGLTVRRLPLEFVLAHTQVWDPTGRFFDGQVSTEGLLGRKSLGVSWDNRWRTEGKMTAEAGVQAESQFVTVRTTIRDASAYLSRSYPFEFSVRSSWLPSVPSVPSVQSSEVRSVRSVQVSGEVTATRSDVGLNLDVQKDSQRYLTSSHAVSWQPLSIASQYQLHGEDGQTGNAHATMGGAVDWTVRTHWTEGSGAQWTGELGVVPHKEEHGYAVLALLTKATVLGRPPHGGLYQEKKYGVDFEYFRNPETEPADVRTSFTVYTGLVSHEARSILQMEKTPTQSRFLSLIDVTITTPSAPLMFISSIEGVKTSRSFNGTASILQNFTSFVPAFLRTELTHAYFGGGRCLQTFQLHNQPTGPALIALSVQGDVLSNNTKFMQLSLKKHESLILNATGKTRFLPKTEGKKQDWVSFLTLRIPLLQNNDFGVEVTKKSSQGVLMYQMNVAEMNSLNEMGSQKLEGTLKLSGQESGVEISTPKRFFSVAGTSSNGQKDVEIIWEKRGTSEKKTRISRQVKTSTSSLTEHSETWDFSHPRLSSPLTLTVQYRPQPRPVVVLALNNMSSHEIGGHFVDDNHFVVTATQSGEVTLNYQASLEDSDKLLQKVSWSSDAAHTWTTLVNRDLPQLKAKLKDLSEYSLTELKTILEELKSYEVIQTAYRLTPTLRNATFIPLIRQRRNAFAFASSSGGCGSGAYAVASAGGGSQCISSGDFSAVASNVHSQISQMMQDMVSKFQNRPQQQSSSHYSGGVINVQLSQASSPCGSSQQQTSYGGCAPSPPSQRSYPQPAASQTHRIEIQLHGAQAPSYPAPAPSYSAPAPSPCSSSGSSSPSPCASFIPSQPSYQQPQQSGYHQTAYAGSGQASYGLSAPYSTSVDAQPSYGPVDAYQQDAQQQQQLYSPPQGAQLHAAQKSNPSGPGSFSVPIGNSRLTIQIHHEGGQPQPAPQPQPQGSVQYAASGSQQSQYAIAGQIPYGGGAEPRLQYCTPGSTEKGVCLNPGEDSLEPTRSKRSAEVADETLGGFAPQQYFVVVKKTAKNAWNTFVAQPEVQYVLDVAQRISEHISHRSRAQLDSVKSTFSSTGSALEAVRGFGPKVTNFLTGTFGGVVVEQQLPFHLASLRLPVPKKLLDSRIGLTAVALGAPSSRSHFYGTATLLGGKVVTTFSGLNYTLEPVPCHYVFAHDFDDGNFTVVLSYEATQNGNSVAELTDVEIIGRLSNFKFKVFRLPKIFKKFPEFTVVGSENELLTVTSTDGWKVVYDPADEGQLYIQVTGMYSSKVAGLAGSFHVVPQHDFITPTRAVHKRNQLGLFVDAWQADDTCSTGSSGH